MRKRYYVEFESNQTTCGSNNHFGGNASTIRNAKSIIAKIKKEYKEENPRNFRIYDIETGEENATCIYQD